jgi:ribosomal protein S18 acetylase RimI-like enzyme
MRKATLNDRAVRGIIFAETRNEERSFLSAWSESMWDAFVADQFRLREVHYTAHYPNADVLMIEARGGAGCRFAIVGTLSIELEPGNDGQRVTRLITIEIGAASRGRGIGTHVINAVAETAAACGCARLELSVAMTNARAEAFYRRLGFRLLEGEEAVAAAPRGSGLKIVEAADFQQMALDLGN